MMSYVYRKRAEKMKRLGVESILYGGMTLFLDSEDGAVSGRLLEEGEWEPDEMHVFVPLLKEKKVVFDVGANIGVYSLVACSKGCEVHAFEPNPRAFGFLSKSVAANGFTATLNQSALSDKQGLDSLYVPSGANGGLASLKVRNGEPSPVPSTMLDAYVDEKHIEEIELMKIDAEGAEEAIIEGAALTIARGAVRNIIMEMSLPMWHKDGGAAVLLASNYRIGIIEGSSIKPIESVFDVKKPWGTSLYLRSRFP